MTAPAGSVAESYVQSILQVVELLDNGETVESLTRRAESLPIEQRGPFLGVLDIAAILAQCVSNAAPLDSPVLPLVSRPAYRKGTARKPIPWNKCLWQPTPEGTQP
ncbi:hypothetical protein [Thermomonas sp.]|uniref:hypothetical protein n=1 Tax=Thermomonas sp. TaxID=1971895 RepID=UPI0035B42B13